MSTWPATHTLGTGVNLSVAKGTNGRFTWYLWLDGIDEDDFTAWCEQGDGDGVSFATADEALDHCCRHLDVLVGRLGHQPARVNLKPVAEGAEMR